MGRLTPDEVVAQLELWRGLRCWTRVPASAVQRDSRLSAGVVYFIAGDVPVQIEIYAGRDTADTYATILHELAHVYHGANHGKAWRNGYLSAVAEVCRVPADDVLGEMRGRPSKAKADRIARTWLGRAIREGLHGSA